MANISFNNKTGKCQPDTYEDIGATTLASVAATEAIQTDSDGSVICFSMDGCTKASIECINTHATATMDFALYKTNVSNPGVTLATVVGNDVRWELVAVATTVAAHGQDMIEYNKEDEGLCKYLILTGLNSTAGALTNAEFIIIKE